MPHTHETRYDRLLIALRPYRVRKALIGDDVPANSPPPAATAEQTDRTGSKVHMWKVAYV